MRRYSGTARYMLHARREARAVYTDRSCDAGRDAVQAGTAVCMHPTCLAQGRPPSAPPLRAARRRQASRAPSPSPRPATRRQRTAGTVRHAGPYLSCAAPRTWGVKSRQIHTINHRGLPAGCGGLRLRLRLLAPPSTAAVVYWVRLLRRCSACLSSSLPVLLCTFSLNRPTPPSP